MRKLKMKKLMSLLLALTMVLALAACGSREANKTQDGSDLDYVKGKGKLIIGYTNYEPMNYTDENGVFTGFDTELAMLTCEKLGLEPEFVEINWDTKEVELNAKSIDCIWNGLTIDDERKAKMEITKPYVKNAQVVLVKEGTAYNGTESLIGKTVVAEQGSAGENTVKADDNLKQANFVPKTLQTDCLMELKSGTADAAVLDLTLAKTMTGEGTSYNDIVIVDYLAEEDYGVAFRKGSDICAEVNKIFDEFFEDGTMAALAEKYGLELAK
ncbi:amino acid ABC transporter substrate-binding protein [Acetivibrio straminisolvens]|jgi:polar amino acid transport system substrate-binding protein|uniref:Amino acid ABC transporter n=1 Tax=Acetivibrio straminisolvens JCM 21531 TaxID=1294263 RepID=W4V116_9FIRM|nr:amino acid ABC transporter substrate-binding protein [Acetivibrio straminisolvens]GAE87190.1 amino acid ABC transporter [Acetivibrio straminisolvens JCM 21531]